MASGTCIFKGRNMLTGVTLLAVFVVFGVWGLTYQVSRKAKLEIIENQFKLRALDFKNVSSAMLSQIQYTENSINQITDETSESELKELDDFLNEYRIQSLERLKAVFASVKVGGEHGYIYVIDSTGTYVVSKDRQRDGMNILNARDATGRYFIKDMIKNAKALGENEAVVEHYFWKNKDEKSPREKIAGMAYVPELDWIVGVSAYLDEIL